MTSKEVVSLALSLCHQPKAEDDDPGPTQKSERIKHTMDYESFKEKFVEDLKDRLDEQGAGISLYFSLLGGKFCAFCNFCPLKALTILYEVNEIRMDDPVPFLKKTVGGKKIFGIIIPCNLFQRSVFSVLGIFAF